MLELNGELKGQLSPFRKYYAFKEVRVHGLKCLTNEVTGLAPLHAQGPVDRRVGHQRAPFNFAKSRSHTERSKSSDSMSEAEDGSIFTISLYLL